MSRKLAVLIGLMMVTGCTLDEVIEHGDTCKDGDENVMTLGYIKDGNETYYREDYSNYLEAFKTNTCPDKSQGCFVDFSETYYCMTKCPSGSIACNGNCVDPNNNADFCGARGDCFSEDASNSRGTACGEGSSCVRGKCEEKEVLVCGTNQKKCAVGNDQSHMECMNILSDKENCGDCGVVCDENEVCSEGNCIETEAERACQLGTNVFINLAEKCGPDCFNCHQISNIDISGISDVSCSQEFGKCHFSKCLSGYHIAENKNGDFCEDNSDESCAPVDSRDVVNCLDVDVAHALPGSCLDSGLCSELACETGYEVVEDACIGVTVDDCNGVVCRESVEHWADGVCEEYACKLTACEVGFYVEENVCVPESALKCGAEQINCGEILEHAVNFDCVDGRCVIQTCESGYHLYEEKCVANSNEHCGSHANACPESSTCIVDKCECNSGYHAFDGICEADDAEHCGSHEIACQKNEVCNDLKCECGVGFHVKGNECEEDSPTVCGAERINCKDLVNSPTFNGLANANGIGCVEGKCVATGCKDGSPCNGECGIRAESNSEPIIYFTNANCGGCSTASRSYACEGMKICSATAVTSTRVSYSCQCPSGYYSDSSGECQVNTAEHCGNAATRCSNAKPYCRLLPVEDEGNLGRVSYTYNWACDVCEAGMHSSSLWGASSDCVVDDIDNCGARDIKCRRNGVELTSCVNGVCVDITCESGYTLCGTTCVNLDRDKNNCGVCGLVCGRECYKGRCRK